jgi:hypothetical protein
MKTFFIRGSASLTSARQGGKIKEVASRCFRYPDEESVGYCET